MRRKWRTAITGFLCTLLLLLLVTPVWLLASRSGDQVIVGANEVIADDLYVGLLLKFLPSWIQSLAAIASSKPLPSLGWGIVTVLLVGIIAIAIALVTFVLTALSAVTFPILIIPIMGLGTLANLALFVSFFLFATFVPQIIVSLLSGYWLMQKLQPNTSSRHFVSLVVGLLVFVILTAMPILGGLLHLATIFLGLGALWIWIRNKRDCA